MLILMHIVESHQPVQERRQVYRSPIRPTSFRFIPTSAQSHVQILYGRTSIPAGGLCKGREHPSQGEPTVNMFQAEKNLQDAWDSCYARSQKNKT
jgi:hypothetical protein